MQVLNLAPCSNLSLVLPHARLTGLHGWGPVGQAVGALYAQDIWDNQVSRLILECGTGQPCTDHTGGSCLAVRLPMALQASLGGRGGYDLWESVCPGHLGQPGEAPDCRRCFSGSFAWIMQPELCKRAIWEGQA